ncbi:ATP/GTP-binding protein [Streptomyces sp. NPDC047108]|uniref:ATP/GTP-binding protein n=1 Tax=Streptomyces sp. NPDC047108 TaxID=3155025 RepID=UPI0033F571C8
MDTEGTYDPRSTRSDHVPRPAGPPPAGAVPPRPASAPPVPPLPPGRPGEGAFLAWLRTPRAQAAPGIWAFGHRPRPPEEPDRIPGRQLLSGALIAFLCGWLLWSLLWNQYLEGWWIFVKDWWLLPMLLLVPDDWKATQGFVAISYLYYALVLTGLAIGFGRIGNWHELWRRYGVPLWPLFVLLPGVWREMPRTASWLEAVSNLYYALLVAAVVAVVGRAGTWPKLRQHRRAEQAAQAPPEPEADPAEWPDLRAAGAGAAADALAAEARAGRMNDVDHARIGRAWQSVQARPSRLDAFVETVRQQGAAACAHPSGARDLPARTGLHDLRTRQVRIGAAADEARNPYAYRGAGSALDPGLLGTSLLAVGPPGAGKTGHLVRPVVEALCLQALAGQAAVVAVGAAGAGLGPDEAFDVVIRIGQPDSAYDLDLYGGTSDPDAAAAMLAEALVGDLAATLPGGDSRRAATALAQVLGPFRAVHGRFPAVPELRELLDGSEAALGGLRSALEASGESTQLRELDARERQSGRAGDAGALLADRIALLDRPAFAGFFDPAGEGSPFSLRALEHPLRVRIDLPERGHAEASRLLARLVLAQFAECATARNDRSLFTCVVLDDATQTVTPESLRGIQRLRSANAGAVLTLRTLEDVPEALRTPLLGAVGCRMAFAGVTTWDGARFAEVWGKEWVEARDITNRQIIADEPLTRVVHTVRRLVTGRAVTAESVTVRRVERERWSASELAHSVPAGHAVLSLTTVRGEHAPPVLVDLRG